jgi:hypothetical protein
MSRTSQRSGLRFALSKNQSRAELSMLAPARIRLLQVARSRLRLAEEDYRSVLENYGGARSARDLDATGFDAVMDRFRALGFTSTARQRSYGERDGMATPGQVDSIRKLWAAWADAPTEANLNIFLERQAKVSALRFLDAAKAGAVITALKVMVERKGGDHGG